MKLGLSVLCFLLAAAGFADNLVKEVMVPAKDGTKLSTIVAVPQKNKKFPVIIYRSPYGKIDPEARAARINSLKKADLAGFVQVSQQCRGTGFSEGEFIPFVAEADDGLALLDWIRKQDFYNGEIFLDGGSYGATVHAAWLNTRQPDIKGIFWGAQDTERYNIIYRNGFMRLRLFSSWHLDVYKKNAKFKRKKKAANFSRFPLSGITGKIYPEPAEDFETVLLHPDQNDPFWKTPGFGGAEYSNALTNTDIPIFFAGSWHDIYITGMIDIWRKLTPEHRKKCVFMITPFDHAYYRRRKNIEPELYSPGALPGEFAMKIPKLAIHWFQHLRQGTPLNDFTKGKVTRYILFGDKWETSDDIGTNSVNCKYYLSQDRKLTAAVPPNGKITYIYDPRDPATFKGACHGNFGGIALQDPPNSRQDIISFISEPFTEDKIVEGDFTGQLHVSSSAPDSCFYLRLSVIKNGKTFGLRNEIDSICRTNPDFIPGKNAVIDFKIVAHNFKLSKGDQLRLDVSSSCWPFFQLHSNYRGIQALQKTTQPARNTILTGKSFIAIPFAKQK